MANKDSRSRANDDRGCTRTGRCRMLGMSRLVLRQLSPRACHDSFWYSLPCCFTVSDRRDRQQLATRPGRRTMTCTEDRDAPVFDIDTTIRDLGDVRRSPN